MVFLVTAENKLAKGFAVSTTQCCSECIPQGAAAAALFVVLLLVANSYHFIIVAEIRVDGMEVQDSNGGFGWANTPPKKT